MRLNAIGDYTHLTDTELDNAYDATWRQLQTTVGRDRIAVSQVVSDIGYNILTRLSSPWSFAEGVLGVTRFPKYNAIQRMAPQGFVQTREAQTSVKDSAVKVAGSIKNYAFGGLGLVGLVAAAYIVFTLSKRK